MLCRRILCITFPCSRVSLCDMAERSKAHAHAVADHTSEVPPCAPCKKKKKQVPSSIDTTIPNPAKCVADSQLKTPGASHGTSAPTPEQQRSQQTLTRRQISELRQRLLRLQPCSQSNFPAGVEVRGHMPACPTYHPARTATTVLEPRQRPGSHVHQTLDAFTKLHLHKKMKEVLQKVAEVGLK